MEEKEPKADQEKEQSIPAATTPHPEERTEKQAGEPEMADKSSSAGATAANPDEKESSPGETAPAGEAQNPSAEAPEKKPTEAAREESPAETAQDEEVPESPDLAETSSEESHLSDEELEGEDDTEEVEGDEEEQEDDDELPDYDHYSPEKLLSAAEDRLKNHPVQKIKEHMEAIRKSILAQLNEERDEKRQQFLAEGGNEIDFEFPQPLREEFRQLFGRYRRARRQFYEDLRQQLENNLKTKRALIEKLRELVTKEESLGETFKEYHAIMQEWRNTGPVPRTESLDLWRSFNHHRDHFYEFVELNKDLRDLDYRKNRQAKQDLIAKAEKLLEMEDLREAFRQLQDLHKRWKNLGPVEPEWREPLWNKFSLHSKALREKREQFFQALDAERAEKLAEKKKLVSQIQNLGTDYKKHNQWQKALQELNEATEAFKKIGRLRHPENDAVWQEFRAAIKNFNRAKNQYYKELKKEQQENLRLKQALVDEAESLKDSEDWQVAADRLKKLQVDWKKIGHVSRKDSDRIWKDFRDACNHFFERLKNRHKAEDQQREANLARKEALLKELENLTLKPDAPQEGKAAVQDFLQKWREAGPVPRGKNRVEKRFNELLDQRFADLAVDRKESTRLRFENKLKSLSDQGGTSQLRKERRFLQQKREEQHQEVVQLENNLSFFSSSNPQSPIVKEAQQKLKQANQRQASLDEQIKMLNVRIRAEEKEAANKAAEEGENP